MINNLKKFINNNLVNILLSLFLIGYCKLLDKNVPDLFIKLFRNNFFRIFLVSCIIYSYNKNSSISLCIALLFTYSMNIIYNKEMKEKYRVELFN